MCDALIGQVMSDDKVLYQTIAKDDVDGSFEIRLRLLGNEVFAVSIAADPLDKKWVSGALIIAIVTVVGFTFLGEPLANAYSAVFDASSGSYEPEAVTDK
jgi:hypothetical protein